MKFHPYDPGVPPTKPSPKVGEKVVIEVLGYPPFKDDHFSIRNPRHYKYDVFRKLREAATRAKKGRACYLGPVAMNITICAPAVEKDLSLVDYEGEIGDTLDGSSGCEFTYLPIIFQDDCQVVSIRSRLQTSDEVSYKVEIEFLDEHQNT